MSMLDLVSGFLYANRWLSWVRCRSMVDQCIACRIISVKNFFFKEEGNQGKLRWGSLYGGKQYHKVNKRGAFFV